MTLFEQTCRVAVDDGRFRMAWVGRSNRETLKVDVVAFAGVVEDYLEKINIDLADEVRSAGPTGMAVKTGVHVLAPDIEKDASMGPWKDDARRMGIRSSGAFPIALNGTVWGALTLYSDQVGYFESDVLRLLDELALDLSFALEFSEREKAIHSLEHSFFRRRSLKASVPWPAGSPTTSTTCWPSSSVRSPCWKRCPPTQSASKNPSTGSAWRATAAPPWCGRC